MWEMGRACEAKVRDPKKATKMLAQQNERPKSPLKKQIFLKYNETKRVKRRGRGRK